MWCAVALQIVKENMRCYGAKSPEYLQRVTSCLYTQKHALVLLAHVCAWTRSHLRTSYLKQPVTQKNCAVIRSKSYLGLIYQNACPAGFAKFGVRKHFLCSSRPMWNFLPVSRDSVGNWSTSSSSIQQQHGRQLLQCADTTRLALQMPFKHLTLSHSVQDGLYTMWVFW